ncbi:hypothetical protein BH23ACT2_BH23ACT2_23860 [soil metagenome]
MANKRDQSRQRRAKDNRAQRAALEARTKGQPAKRPSRVAPSTAEKLERTAKERPAPVSGSGAAGPEAEPTTKRSGGLFGGGRPRPVRPGDVPVDVDELEGSWFSRVNHVPGGRQIIMGALMTLVVSAMITFVESFVAVEERGDPDAQPTETLFEAVDNVPAALVVLGVPILAAGASLYFATHPQRRRVWTFAAVAVGVILLQTLYIPYVFVIGFLFFAIRKSSKVEGPRSRRGRPVDAEDESVDEDEDHLDQHDGDDHDLEVPVDDEAGGTVADAPGRGDGPISTKGWLPGRRRSGG